jgi:hypothetical protein
MRFKLDKKPTGLARIAFNRGCNIIEKDKCVGRIDGNGLYVRVMVVKKNLDEDLNKNCKWRWITLDTPDFEDMNDAKTWAKDNWEQIKNTFDLYMGD